MSELSPYTFHIVGAEGEPKHYELRDLSGRVVCKGFLGRLRVAVVTDSKLWTRERVGYIVEELEALMRGAVGA